MRIVSVLGLGFVAGGVACGATTSPDSPWTCETVDVPGGQSVECQTSGSATGTSDGTPTTCTAGDVGCPSANTTVDGPAPASGGATTDGQGGSGGTGTSPPGGNTTDGTNGGGGGTGTGTGTSPPGGNTTDGTNGGGGGTGTGSAGGGGGTGTGNGSASGGGGGGTGTGTGSAGGGGGSGTGTGSGGGGGGTGTGSGAGGGTTNDGSGGGGGTGTGTPTVGGEGPGGGTLPPGSSPECIVPDILGCRTTDGAGGGSSPTGSGGGASLPTGSGSGSGSGGSSPTGSGGGGRLPTGSGSGTGSGGSLPTGSGSGSGGSSPTGGGYGPTANGGGHLPGNGHGVGNGGSTPTGSGTGCGSSGSTTPTTTPPSGGGKPGKGGGGGGGGPSFTCYETSTSKKCVMPPTCLPGTHAAACGACVDDGTTVDCESPMQGGCWVTGGGFILDSDGRDSFGGNAKSMKDGTVQGDWENVDHDTGNKAHGRPTYLYCRHVPGPGPGQPGGKKGLTANQVYYGGPARWFEATTATWKDGYWFDVVAEDHGEGQAPPDFYQITVRLMNGANSSGAIVFQTSANLSGGNIQIHPPNNGHPYQSSSLPAWVQVQP